MEKPAWEMPAVPRRATRRGTFYYQPAPLLIMRAMKNADDKR
jgi:hypothetical protein